MPGKVKDWITVNGVHVPIYDGETKDDAAKRSIKMQQDNIKKNQKEKEKQIKDNEKEKPSNKTLNAAQKEILRQTNDYNKETYDDFKRELRDLYDDNAYNDPYFDRDEYEDELTKAFKKIQDEISNLYKQAERKDYIGWSEDANRADLIAAKRLEQLKEEYEKELQKQQRSGRYRTH